MNKYEFTRPWFRKNQLLPYINLDSNQILNILEIGSFEGGSTTWFIDEFLKNENSKISCIDPWLNYNHSEDSLNTYGETSKDRNIDNNEVKKLFYKNIEATGKSNQVEVFHNFSHIQLPKLLTENRSYDLVFIDGNHTTSFVITDAVMSWYMLKSGGLMVFDDYRWGLERNLQSRPKYAVDSFINCFKGYLNIISDKEYCIVRKK
jgi:predicted O-methyltransferase YrrM